MRNIKMMTAQQRRNELELQKVMARVIRFHSLSLNSNQSLLLSINNSITQLMMLQLNTINELLQSNITALAANHLDCNPSRNKTISHHIMATTEANDIQLDRQTIFLIKCDQSLL